PGPLAPVLLALLLARGAREEGRGHGPTVGAGLAPALGGSCPARRTPPPPLRAGTSPPSGEEANGLPLGVLRRFPGPLEPVLLALLLARVAREEGRGHGPTVGAGLALPDGPLRRRFAPAPPRQAGRSHPAYRLLY